jgi:predicted DNA-binding protein
VYIILNKEDNDMSKRMNFYLAEIQIKRLNSMSKKTGLSASEILRRAIDEYWEKFKEKERG